ncbi:Protein NPP-4 [Aphelenchoides avenae]|nr:Protein NPP-4 [Aphelenchus avenae]
MAFFGQQPQATTTSTGLFGLGGTAQPTSAPQSLFGTTNTAAPASGSLFGTATTAPAATSAPALFGATAATSAAPLFGSTAATSAEPLFGSTAATSAAPLFGSTAPTSAPSLFGATAATTAPSLFGASTTTTSAAPSLFGTVGTQQPAGAQFGATTTTTAAVPSLFGTTTTASAGLFGQKPPGSLFPTTTSAPAATAGSIFAPAATATTAPQQVGLGGSTASTLGVGGIAATATGPSSQNQTNPMDGEVPQEILNEFVALRNKMKRSKELAEEFAMAASDESMKVEEQIAKALRRIHNQKISLQNSRVRMSALADKVTLDNRVAEQVSKRHEQMSKNPQFGRNQAIQYMHHMVQEYEAAVVEYQETFRKVNRIMGQVAREKETTPLYAKELVMHLNRYAGIHKAVAQQVHELDEQVQELKELLVEQRRKIYGRYVPNPFEKRKDMLDNVDSFASLKGIEAFPSQTALMALSEMLPKTAQPPSTSTASTFGTTGSLFGPKPATGSLFFNAPTAAATSAPSLFKPFGSTTTTAAPAFLTTTTTTPSLFGTATTASTAATTTFGSTLNSSASGTLFGGSASKAPLFGK